MAKKYRRVTLSRSTGGTVAIFVFLALVGSFMVLPIVYVLVTAFKPLNEILAYPPKFFVRSPTLNNFSDLIEITQETWIPFERSLFNSMFIAIVGTVAYMCGFAYIISMIVYQIGGLFTGEATFGVLTVIALAALIGMLYLLLRKGYQGKTNDLSSVKVTKV